MASTRGGAPPQFILTPQQQNLLFRALTSNQPSNGNNTGNSNNNNNNHTGSGQVNGSSSTQPLSLSPESLTNSPSHLQRTNGFDSSNGIQESPLLDYDYDFGPDSSFDFDFANETQGSLIGDLPNNGLSKSDSKDSTPENDSSDKRSLPNDDEDDEFEEGGGKRRESEGKAPKKPGRKPLMNEPSSKRKAQNRAAQRAFRERKEKHLKDLETKVEELEKASTAANNENSQLRTKIDKLTMELAEYKKRVQAPNSDMRSMNANKQTFGSSAIGSLNEVNFSFEFPKFGSLPGPQDHSASTNTSPSYSSPHSNSNSSKHNSPANSGDQASPNTTTSRANSETMSKEALSKLTGGLGNGSLYDHALFGNASRSSLDSNNFGFSSGNTGSPSSSSNSNAGPSSSCGTSPEPCTQSPHGFKPLDTLTTIGEEQPTNDSQAAFGHFGNVDFSNIDWLSQQNGGQFDPQLFGGYREPQNNVLAGTTFDDSFFNDAFDVDFTEPFNMAPSQSQPAPKKNLIAEIDNRKETEDTITSNGKLLTCNNIWEKLQTCPKVQNGDLDLDGLCTDLQKKAKCGGTGAVVDELDFQTIMTKYLGADAKNCPGTSS